MKDKIGLFITKAVVYLIVFIAVTILCGLESIVEHLINWIL